MKTVLSASHDIIYPTAPRTWYEGIPLGNGSIGAMLWGGGPLHITMDSCRLWDLRTPPVTDPRYRYAHFKKLYRRGRIAEIRDFFAFRRDAIVPTRLPGPRVELDFGGAATEFSARLDLAGATARGMLRTRRGTASWEAWTASGEDVLVLAVTGVPAKALRLRARLDHLNAAARADLRRRGFVRPVSGDHWLYQAVPENGGYLLAWRVVAQDKGCTFLITLLVGADCASLRTAAEERLRVAEAGLSDLRAHHEDWWRDFWKRSSVVLPEESLAALYHVEMYKFGCNARADAPLPVALQGVWSPDGEMPPWHGDYHNDLNVQFALWPAYASNRLDAALPFYDWAARLLPVFEKECRRFFGCEGAFVPCALGPNGERVYGYETVETWPGNGAWIAHQFWLHYLHSRDERFLREKAWPFLRACMQLYAGILEKGRDGLYHIPLGSSAEYCEDRPEAWGEDPSGDLAFIRFLGEALLQSAKTLGLKDPAAPRWRDILKRLAPYPTRKTMTPRKPTRIEAALRGEEITVTEGRLNHLEDALFVMKDMPYLFSHRHLTHLFCIHPLGLLTIEDGPAAQKTIRDSMHLLWVHGAGAWAGHGITGAAGLAARVRMPEMALRLLREYAAHYVMPPALLHMNSDFRGTGHSRYGWPVTTLETGFSVCGVIHEMLLQSWRDTIRVFPAAPESWRDAAFRDLRAEGAFLVSAERKHGATRWVRIRSEKGLPCRVKNPFGKGPVTLKDLATGRTRTLRGAMLRFATRPGGEYRLAASARGAVA